MRVASAVVLAAVAVQVYGCRPAPCEEGCTRLYTPQWDFVSKKELCVDAGTSVNTDVAIHSCHHGQGTVVSASGACAVDKAGGVVCTGAGVCSIQKQLTTEGWTCDCPDTCTRYSQAKTCAKGQCYNSGSCQCVGEENIVQCFVDPCSPAVGGDKLCGPGYKCFSDYCGGCNARCVKDAEPTAAPATRAPVTNECKSNDDCGAGFWCRSKQDASGRCLVEKECVKRQPEGGRCGGFTLPCFQEACLEGLTCPCSEPTCDAPGTCTKPVVTPTPATPAPVTTGPIICCLAVAVCKPGYRQFGNYLSCPRIAKRLGICVEESICCSQVACWLDALF